MEENPTKGDFVSFNFKLQLPPLVHHLWHEQLPPLSGRPQSAASKVNYNFLLTLNNKREALPILYYTKYVLRNFTPSFSEFGGHLLMI